jgi:hypothetical protein
MKLKNLLFQPLTLNLSVDNEGLHLNGREVKDVLEHQISDEIRLAAARGLVSLIGKVSDGIDNALGADVGSAEPPGSSVATVDDPQSNPKKGNRK